MARVTGRTDREIHPFSHSYHDQGHREDRHHLLYYQFYLFLALFFSLAVFSQELQLLGQVAFSFMDFLNGTAGANGWRELVKFTANLVDDWNHRVTYGRVRSAATNPYYNTE